MKDIDPLDFQPPLPIPHGFTRETIIDILSSMTIDGFASEELDNYLKEDCNRFLYTLDMIPDHASNILEVGANPYFLTHLMRLFRPRVDLQLINFFGGNEGVGKQAVSAGNLNGERGSPYTVDYHNINIETSRLPFVDSYFDTILYCEVIEHLVNDPMQSIAHLKRVLKPGGALILTTPNVARLENVAKIISGANIYDPYSGYGQYGRHNREYNRHELHKLMRYCGFTEEVLFSADVHPNRACHFVNLNKFQDLVAFRSNDLGQYLFSKWRNTGALPMKKPSWLYRSLPPGRIDSDAVL